MFRPRPLWVDRVGVGNYKLRASRVIIEAPDIEDRPRPWFDPRIGSIARDLAVERWVSNRPKLGTTAAAAVLAAAVRTAQRGTPPLSGGVAYTASPDVDAELTRLRLVARAFTGPIVRDALRVHVD